MIDALDKQNLVDSLGQLNGSLLKTDGHAKMALTSAQATIREPFAGTAEQSAETLLVAQQLVSIIERLASIQREVVLLDVYAHQLTEQAP